MKRGALIATAMSMSAMFAGDAWAAVSPIIGEPTPGSIEMQRILLSRALLGGTRR